MEDQDNFEQKSTFNLTAHTEQSNLIYTYSSTGVRHF
jgi:hypothetical protein